MAVYFWLLAIRKESWQLYALTGIILGVSLYTYALSYLAVPIFLLCMLSYLLYLGK